MSYENGQASMAEYIAANQDQLAHMISLMDAVLSKSNVVIAEKAWPDSIAVICQGALNPEDLMLDNVGSDGVDVVSTHNTSLLNIANGEFYGLRSRLSAMRDQEEINQKVKGGQDVDEAIEEAIRENRLWLDYAHADAYFRRPSVFNAFELVRTRLHGVERYGEATRYKAMQADQEIVKTLGMTIIKNNVIYVSIDIDPVNDPVLARFNGLEGVDNNLLSLVLSGLYSTEDSLDEMLGVLRSQFPDTTSEAAVDEALEEAREFAVAKKETHAMGLVVGPPSEEDFNQFKELIDQESRI